MSRKGQTWHEEIKAALNNARVLLAVLSPSFLESENCRFELQHFLDCHKDPDPKKLAESVIKIVKHQIDSKALPAAIREPEAFQLFVNDLVKGELSYYHPGTGLRADRQQEFMDELERLANRLAALLKQSGEVAASPPSLTVFLAVPHPESTVGELYQRIKAELARRKVAVVPDRSRFYSVLDEPDSIVVEQAVTNARLAVHLLDPSASGGALAADTRQIDATDRRAMDASQLSRLIWVKSKAAGTADNALVASLRRLHDGGGRLFESDRLVEDSSERFIELLIRTLFPADERTTAAGAAKICYLLVDRDDDAAVRQLALPALASRGLSARLPMPAKLADGDRVAIYWGSKNADWVFGELTRLGTTRPIVLIKGPPGAPEKAAFFAGEVGETIDLTLPSPPGAIT
jgi:TIR domain